MGVMLYEVLSGHMPFEGETLHAVVIHSTTSPHVPLQEQQPRLDPALCALVESCLCKEPSQRPADATELLARLGPLLADPALRAELETPLPIEQAPARAAGSSHSSQDDSAPSQRDAMPFADTAISLTPRLIDSDMRPVPRRRNNGVWISVLVVLAVATGGFVWALERVNGDPAQNPPEPEVQAAQQAQPKPAPVFQPTPPPSAGTGAEANVAATKRPAPKNDPAHAPVQAKSVANKVAARAEPAAPKLPAPSPNGEPAPQPSAAEPAPDEEGSANVETAPEVDPSAVQSTPDGPASTPAPAAPIDEMAPVDLPPPEPPEPNSTP
jgi:cytoskeletal protein RodZ